MKLPCCLLLLVTLIVLVTDNGLAFSPPYRYSTSSHSAPMQKGPTGTATTLYQSSTRATTSSTSSSSSTSDPDYDYDELMKSELEQGRLSNQYAHFGHEDWLAHRATDRFYRNLLNFDKSPIIKSLLDEAALLTAVCVAIIAWNELLIEGYTDFNAVHHDAVFSDVLPDWAAFKWALPKDPFFLCGGPLGLLLVFRNDVSFGRYKEAFHYWEVVVSSLSNMQLMAAHSSTNVAGVRDMGAASWALCRTLQHEVSGGYDEARYERDIREKVPDLDRAHRLLGARNRLYRAKYDLHDAVDVFSDEITNLDKRTLINTVNIVATACVECERLYTTPIPLLYTRHTLKFLTLWMTFMPFAFYDLFASSWNHVAMIPAIVIICFLFLGIEAIAVSLEEPHSILPLDEMIEELYLDIEDTETWMMKSSSAAL